MTVLDSFDRTAVRTAGSIERLIITFIAGLRQCASNEERLHLFNQFLGLAREALHSELGQDLSTEFASRLRMVLNDLSGRSILTVVIAEFLRGRITVVEQGSRKLIDVARGTSLARQTRGHTHSVDILAVVIRKQAEIFSTEVRLIEADCAQLHALIPSAFSTLTERMRIDGERLWPGAATAQDHGTQATASTAIEPPLGAQHLYHTRMGKSRDLRYETRIFGHWLLASMKQLRDNLDAAQRDGSYEVTALHAVTTALCEEMARVSAHLADLIDKAQGSVHLFGR